MGFQSSMMGLFQVYRQLDFVAVHLHYATQILNQPDLGTVKPAIVDTLK